MYESAGPSKPAVAKSDVTGMVCPPDASLGEQSPLLSGCGLSVRVNAEPGDHHQANGNQGSLGSCATSDSKSTVL